MAEKERIANPTMGSNQVGSETKEAVRGKGVSAGSDTQLKMAALSTENKEKKKVNTPESAENHVDFPEAHETDE